MGVFGFVAAGGGSIGVLLGGLLTDALDWHWIFLVNMPVGVAVIALTMRAPGRRRGGRRPAARRRRCGDRDRVADARRVRDRERQRGRLDVRPDARDSCCGRSPARGVPRHRVAGRVAADAAGPVPPAQRRGVQRRRRPVGRRDVRVVLPLRALPAAGAGLQPAGGRPRVPAGQPDHGRLLARACRPRSSCGSASGCRSPPGCCVGGRAGAVRPGAGRRPFVTDVLPEHDPARPRRGHGVQPDAARRDERRRAERVGPRVGRGQHLVHDGRRARPGGPGQPGRVPQRQPGRGRRGPARGAQRRLPGRLRGRCRLRRRRRPHRRRPAPLPRTNPASDSTPEAADYTTDPDLEPVPC